jgi:hypothetical protein
MSFQSLKARVKAAVAKMPRPKGKPAVMIFAQRFDPENPPCVDLNSWEPDPADPRKSRHPIPWDGVETATYWRYTTDSDLKALHARFDRLYGPAVRAPEDGPCFFIELMAPPSEAVQS